MKRYFSGTVVFLVIFIALAVAASAQESLKEGKWFMTMVTKWDNMPPEMAAAMKKMQNMPPEVMAMLKAKGMQFEANDQGMTTTITQCITHKNPVPQHMKSNMVDYCQQTHEIDGDTVNFHTTCDHDNFHMDASGSLTYSGDSMQGHFKSHEVTAGKATDATVDITGQYLGPCS